MSYLVNTIREHLRKQIDHFQRDAVSYNKMIFMVPAMKGTVLVSIAEGINNDYLKDPRINLIIKIAPVLDESRDKESIAEARKKGWYSEDRDLTYTRNTANENNNQLLVVVLFGSDQVSDSSGLEDFHKCDLNMLWSIEMERSFSRWITEKLESSGIYSHTHQEIQEIDKILKVLYSEGVRDLIQISNWLSKLNLISAKSVSDVPKIALEQLEAFNLPVLSSIPTSKHNHLGKYIREAEQFFSYSRFIESNYREKALKSVEALQNNIANGEDVNPEVYKEKTYNVYGSLDGMLSGLKKFIDSGNEDERKRLMKCDFVVINNNILKTKEAKSREKKEASKKIAGSPVEVCLEAIWRTLGKCGLNSNGDKAKSDIEAIEIYTILFKHDLVDDYFSEYRGDTESKNSMAKRYLDSLIGGVGDILGEYIEVKNTNGSRITIRSEGFSSETEFKYSKNSESELKFGVTVIFNGNGKDEKRVYGWRLPENHMYRLATTLLSRADQFLSESEDRHRLPVFHTPYYGEMLNATDGEEVKRVFLHAMRETRASKAIATNLLSKEWIGVDDLLLQNLKLLASSYGDFIRKAASGGIFSAIFGDNQEWKNLYSVYKDSFEAVFKLPRAGVSELAGMLVRTFLIVESRSSQDGVSWHAQKHENSGILTILHPAVVEMLEAQTVFLTQSFSFLANKELQKDDEKGLFKDRIWRRYVDFASIQSPLVGLLCEKDQKMCTDTQGSELIHIIGSSSELDGILSTRLPISYNEETIEESSLTDSEMFHETSESSILYRFMVDYFDLHPHTRDGLSIAIFKNKGIQPVFAAIHAYLKELTNKGGERYLFGDKHNKPYVINVTIITESGDDSDIYRWVQQWKERWVGVESGSKYDFYQKCLPSISHRIVEKNVPRSFQKLISGHFEVDMVVLYDFISNGDNRSDIDSSAPFDITKHDLKFPILDRVCCSVKSPGRLLERKRIVNNQQFELGTCHARLLDALQSSNSKSSGSIIVSNSGDFKPWEDLVGGLHDKAGWVICVDPSIDERLIKGVGSRDREIIGFGSGVGNHGEDNYTISTKKFSLANIEARLQASIKQLYAEGTGWSVEDWGSIATNTMKAASSLSGLSLVRATGAEDSHIHDFMAYAMVRKMLQNDEKPLSEFIISLDAYRHWFELAEGSSRPDLLSIKVWLEKGECLRISMHLIECKLGKKSEHRLEEGIDQITKGLVVLSDIFRNRQDLEEQGSLDAKRTDQRYWWMQLHRLIASKTEVDRVKYDEVMAALECLAEGDFEVEWKASLFAFWTDEESDLRWIKSWTASKTPPVEANIYTAGSKFVHSLMAKANSSHIDWDAIEGQAVDDFSESKDASGGSFEVSEELETALPLAVEESETALPLAVEPNKDLRTEHITTTEPASEVALRGDETAISKVFLGKTTNGDNSVYWEFAHSGLANRHILIFGSSGQGKTYAIQCILWEMKKFSQNSLIIDYTDGFLPDHLEKETRTNLNPKQHVVQQDPLPINPFLLRKSNRGGLIFSENATDISKRVSGLFDLAYSLGDQQYSILYDTIKEGVELEGSKMSLEYLLEGIKVVGSGKGISSKSAQTLYNKIRPFVDGKPFSSGSGDLDWDNLFRKKDPFCNIFQLAGIDRRSSQLITEFVLWDLYGHLQSKGNKTDPKVIVLDEVHNLNCQDEFPLAKYIREGRKFGISLILATQTMSNMKKSEQDLMFMADHKLFFRPSDTELSSFANIAATILGQSVSEWKDNLSGLKKGECYSIGKVLDSEGNLSVSRAFKIRISSLGDRSEYD